MTWSEVIEDPCLRDLPFKIELNEWGQIVMSPAANNHADYQSAVYETLFAQKVNGKLLMECAIETSKNVKVPDVVWMSEDFKREHYKLKRFDTWLKRAPELCVEVVSPSNSKAELTEKRALYFECGALEVWFCSGDGEMSFFNSNGPVERSALFPNFPSKVVPE